MIGVVIIIVKDDDLKPGSSEEITTSLEPQETSIVSESRRVNISLDLTDGLVVT